MIRKTFGKLTKISWIQEQNTGFKFSTIFFWIVNWLRSYSFTHWRLQYDEALTFFCSNCVCKCCVVAQNENLAKFYFWVVF